MDRKRRLIFLLAWVATSWVGYYFHEPWRDEAQAWLVARHSDTLWELLYRASAEATGPVYYLLLWPFARLLPAHFVPLSFLVSWTGSLLALSVILLSPLFPLRVAALVAFGYLFGYEYAVPARLYGWGCFFLLSGIWADQNGRRNWATLSFVLACWVQLNFCFGVLGWCVYQMLERRGFWRYWPAFASSLGMLAFMQWGRNVFPWGEWHYPGGAVRVFSTLSVAFLPLPGMGGWAGAVVAPLGLYLLSPKQRLAFLFSFLPFVLLFTCRYTGYASSRHGGALFVLWVLFALSSGALASKSKKRVLYLLLALGSVSGLMSYGDDLLRSYSQGLAAAKKALAIAAAEKKAPVLLSLNILNPMVLSAAMDVPYYIHGIRKDCPIGPGSCFSPPVAQPKTCPQESVCFLVAGSDPPGQIFSEPGTWETVFRPEGKSIKLEDGFLYRFHPAPRP